MPTFLRTAELTTAGLGVVLLGFAGWSSWAAERAVQVGLAARDATALTAELPGGDPHRPLEASTAGVAPAAGSAWQWLAQADWAPGRVRAYALTLANSGALVPDAVLRIPKLGIEAAVFDGTDERVLNLGVGRVPGTARVGESGNLALAGHRDGFFRRLEHIATGDTIDVVAGNREWRYRVERTLVVEPTDVHVLDRTDAAAITLITCYPFRFAGRAPQRFVVRATRIEPTNDR